jgi:micrococcal nuclease
MLALLCWLAIAWADTFEGLVVKVADGDTVTVFGADGLEYRVRFAQIDAPEKKQPFGPEAKDKLSALVLGRMVTVDYAAVDRYGRYVGQVFFGSVDVNFTLVRDGYAWVYRAYPHTPAYIVAETEAQHAQRGLWARPNPQAPWDYRRAVRSAAKSADQQTQ